MTSDATLQTINGEPTLRFERRLAHPPTKVWRAVSEPAELAAWFPAAIEVDGEMRPGAPMRFTFGDEAPIDADTEGQVLEVDPPHVFMFRWIDDVLRFELIPDGDGCRLVFTQTVGGGALGLLGAARTATGWDNCLAVMDAHLDGRPAPDMVGMLDSIEHYTALFGLGEGAVRESGAGYELHFARDLMWMPVADAWRLLVGDTAPGVGAAPPSSWTGESGETGEKIEAGAVTKVDAPHLLEYAWRDAGDDAGTVRWEFFSSDVLGMRVEVTQTVPGCMAERVPRMLATWHERLERFFAASQGVRRAGDADRVERLTAHYRDVNG